MRLCFHQELFSDNLAYWYVKKNTRCFQAYFITNLFKLRFKIKIIKKNSFKKKLK